MSLKKDITRRLDHIKSISSDAGLRNDVRKIPKYEFHVHLGGSIRRTTLADLARKNGVNLPASNKHFLNAASLIEFSSGLTLWELFHKIYLWSWSCVKSCEDIERIVVEFLEDSYNQGVVHSEFTVSGSYLMKNFPFDEWTDAVGSGIGITRKGVPIAAAAILDVSRRSGPEEAECNIKKVIEKRPPAICGIGMGGDEVAYPSSAFKGAFEMAREAGLDSTVHVAEFNPGEVTIGVINELRPRRLGHALNTVKSAEAYRLLRNSGLHVESCPTCNYVGGMGGIDDLSKHPVRRYFDDGIPVSINTDDPQIFGYDLIDTYAALYKEGLFSCEELQMINARSAEAAFIGTTKRGPLQRAEIL